MHDLRWIKRGFLCLRRHTVLPIPALQRVSGDDLGWSAIFLVLPALLAGGFMLLTRYLTGLLVPYYMAPFILLIAVEYGVSSLDQMTYMVEGGEKKLFWSHIAALMIPLAKIFLLAETAEYYFGAEMAGIIIALPIAGRIGWLTAAATVDRREKSPEPTLFQQIGTAQWSIGVVLLLLPLLFFFMLKSFFFVVPLLAVSFLFAWLLDMTKMEKRRIVGFCAEFSEIVFLLLVPILMYAAERIL